MDTEFKRIESTIIKESDIKKGQMQKYFNKEKLFLSFTSVLLEDDMFNGFKNLKYLFFEKNKIDDIKISFLKSLPNLKGVVIKNNTIKTIHDHFFNELPNLISINFSENNIDIINKSIFKDLPSLKELYFKNNSIGQINDYLLNRIENLKEFYFGFNHVIEIKSPLLINVPALKFIFFNNNAIGHINVYLLYDIRNLEEITFTENRFFNICNSLFDSLSSLERLIFKKNLIIHYNGKLFSRIHNIEYLLFSQNKMPDANLENWYSNYPSLKDINFYNNSIINKKVFDFMNEKSISNFKISFLKSIFQIKDKPDSFDGLFKMLIYFLDCPKLIIKKDNYCEDEPKCVIKMSENIIWEFSNGIKNLIQYMFLNLNNLNEINFDNNSIEFFPNEIFKGLINLKRLSFRSNKIQNLDQSIFLNLKNLNEINFDNNSIKSFSNETFKGLINLERLSFRSNKIKNINKSIFDNNSNYLNLINLDLANNRICSLKRNFYLEYENINNITLNFTGNSLSVKDLCSIHWDLDSHFSINYECKFTLSDFINLLEFYGDSPSKNRFLSDKKITETLSEKGIDISSQREKETFLIRKQEYNFNLFISCFICNTDLEDFYKNRMIYEKNVNLFKLLDEFNSFYCSFLDLIIISRSTFSNNFIYELFDKIKYSKPKIYVNIDLRILIEESFQALVMRKSVDLFKFLEKENALILDFSFFDYRKVWKYFDNLNEKVNENEEDYEIEELVIIFFESIFSNFFDKKNNSTKFNQSSVIRNQIKLELQKRIPKYLNKKWYKLINYSLKIINWTEKEDEIDEIKSIVCDINNDDDDALLMTLLGSLTTDHIENLHFSDDLKKIVDKKWKYSAQLVYNGTLLIYFFFMIFYSIYILEYKTLSGSWNSYSKIASLFFLVFNAVLESFQINFSINLFIKKERQKKFYIFSSKNIFECFTYLLAFATIFLDYNQVNIVTISITILLSYGLLVIKMDKFYHFGVYIRVIGKIMTEANRLVVIMIIFLIAFCLSFKNLEKNFSMNEDDFIVSFNSSFELSLFKTITMMIGSLETEGMGLKHINSFSFINFFVYSIFIYFMSILLLNIFTGITIDKLNELFKSASIDDFSGKIDYIQKIEHFKKIKYVRLFITVIERVSILQEIFKKIFSEIVKEIKELFSNRNN